MKVIGEVNNISKELLATIPKLKNGQVAIFKMLTGVEFLHTNEDGSEFKTVEYGNVQIPLKETIKDLDGSYKEIAVVENHNNNIVTRTRWFIPGLGEKFTGRFSCVGGNIRDEELFQHLWISNRNNKNPNRDTSIEPLFEPVDYANDSKESLKKRSKKLEALNYLEDCDIAQIRELTASLNRDDSRDEETMRDELMQIAEDDPAMFLKNALDPVTKTKAVLKKALENEIIKYDRISGKLSWGGTSNVSICTLGKVEGVEPLDQIGDWIQTNTKNGISTLKNIKEKLKAKLNIEVAPVVASENEE